MSRESLRYSQKLRLRALLREIYPQNAFYRRKFTDAGLDGGRLETLLESGTDVEGLLTALPLTTKPEVQADQDAHPPYGSNLTYPASRYSRLHQTSGTTGRPILWLDTLESWQWFLDCWQQVYEGIPLLPTDRLFFPFSFGPFFGFWGAFESACQRGNLCLPGGGMTSVARLRLLLENQVTVLVCTPTYALRLAEVGRGKGIDIESSPVRAIVVAGEPGGSIEATRKRIERAWGARCYDHCGMTEMGAVGFECLENPGGMHIVEDEFIVEVLDPASEKPSGAEGELVLTNLGRLGSPLIRYRTGDLVRWSEEPCPCGRSSGRLVGGILGRRDDMFFLKGNNVYPAAIEAVVRRFEEVAEYRVRILESEDVTALEIELDASANVSEEGRERLARRVQQAIRDTMLFGAEVKLVPPGSLPRFDMKAKRIVRERLEASAGGSER